MKLIPQPQKLTLGQGAFCLRYPDRVTLDTTCGSSAYRFAMLLTEEIEIWAGLCLTIDRRSGNFHRGIRLTMDATVGAEAYTLSISEEGVTVTGGDDAGLLYGVQTLRQLLRQCGPALPCLEIQDWPALSARGLFYDVTRGRIPTMDFLKKLADFCSLYKLNQLHLYVEHTFLFDGFSEIWRDDTPLTAQDILELDAYCRNLEIELVPSVATLGHLYKVLRTETFHALSELEEKNGAEFSFYQRMAHHTLDVNNEKSLELVYGMIDQFLPLFTSNRFNINGDEPFDLGRGRGAQMAEEIGSHQMYVDWIGKICRYVESKGKQPMFWGDVIVAEPETIRALPEDIICMNWNYNPQAWDMETRKLAEAGANQYLCPGVQGWKQTINRMDDAYSNIQRMATYAHKFGAKGFLVTEWGDFGHLQDPESSLPGIIYAAAMGWNRALPTEEELNEAVSVLEYTDRSGEVMSILRRMSQQVVMNWGSVVEYAEIQGGRIPDKTMERFWQDFLPQIEANLSRAGEVNEEIDRCQEELCARMPQMDSRGRKRMLPYLIMSDGQKLLNRLAVAVTGKHLGKTSDITVCPVALAADLERWYQEYKRLWYRTSRESELYRLGEVIFWLADRLRKDF